MNQTEKLDHQEATWHIIKKPEKARKSPTRRKAEKPRGELNIMNGEGMLLKQLCLVYGLRATKTYPDGIDWEG